MKRNLAAVALAVALAARPGSARATDRDPWFARDKALHFGASAALASAGYGVAALLTPERPTRVATAAGFAFGIGIAKEIADRYTGGDPSWRDLTWDAVGTVTGVAVAWLVDRLVSRR